MNNKTTNHSIRKALGLPLAILIMLTGFICGYAQPANSWQPLFNGKDLTGWAVVGGAGKVTIENGTFVLQETPNTTEHTFIHTKKKYRDFILELDAKRDSTLYYGVLVRAINAPDTAQVKLYGYQVKVDYLKTRRWTGGIVDDFGKTANWMINLTNDKRAQGALKKAGNWDHYRIECTGDNIRVWINDVPTANMVNHKYPEGYISLKIHYLRKPKQQVEQAWIKDVKIFTGDVNKFLRPIDIPLTTVN